MQVGILLYRSPVNSHDQCTAQHTDNVKPSPAYAKITQAGVGQKGKPGTASARTEVEPGLDLKGPQKLALSHEKGGVSLSRCYRLSPEPLFSLGGK